MIILILKGFDTNQVTLYMIYHLDIVVVFLMQIYNIFVFPQFFVQ